jgi:hypothetical protein
MRCLLPLLVLLLFASLVLPVSAADPNRIGYVAFNQVTIALHDGNARVEVDYTLDAGMPLVVLIFGRADLENKIEKALNFPSAKAEEVGLTHAVFTVAGAAEDYGNRAYWFGSHKFGVTFPIVRIEAPGSSITYSWAKGIPKGFGYFGDRP